MTTFGQLTKKPMKEKFLAVLLHIIEVIAMFGIAYLAHVIFHLDVSETAITGIVLAALAKAQREFGADYVNK